MSHLQMGGQGWVLDCLSSLVLPQFSDRSVMLFYSSLSPTVCEQDWSLRSQPHLLCACCAFAERLRPGNMDVLGGFDLSLGQGGVPVPAGDPHRICTHSSSRHRSVNSTAPLSPPEALHYPELALRVKYGIEMRHAGLMPANLRLAACTMTSPGATDSKRFKFSLTSHLCAS